MCSCEVGLRVMVESRPTRSLLRFSLHTCLHTCSHTCLHACSHACLHACLHATPIVSSQDLSGGKPVLLEGTDLPLWGMEIDPSEAQDEFMSSAATNNTGGQVHHPGGLFVFWMFKFEFRCVQSHNFQSNQCIFHSVNQMMFPSL